MQVEENIEQAVKWLRDADALSITQVPAWASIPACRTSGFWRAYPALGRRGTHFSEIAAPDAFGQAQVAGFISYFSSGRPCISFVTFKKSSLPRRA